MDKFAPSEELNFDGNIADNRRCWKRFGIFALASGLSAKIQPASYLHVAGTEALEIYNTFTWESYKSKVAKEQRSLTNTVTR